MKDLPAPGTWSEPGFGKMPPEGRTGQEQMRRQKTEKQVHYWLLGVHSGW